MKFHPGRKALSSFIFVHCALELESKSIFVHLSCFLELGWNDMEEAEREGDVSTRNFEMGG
jgi:hypothetical protein